MAHGLNSVIKREIDCGSGSNNVASKSSSLHGGSIAQPNNASNARMGSRRIFTPQFKLQVLDSYRNDGDCKGNQRATARKYGIHRRQIQKWLQCENNLRSSVANLNQNNVKHQFHNISHHQMTVSAVAAANTHANSNNHHNQQPQPFKATALDTARHTVALTTSPCSSTPCPPAATAQLVAATKCMNGGGSALVAQSTMATNTVSIHQPYNHTPAIQHHHQYQHQHQNVLMPSACLPVLPQPVSPVPVPTAALELRDFQPINGPGNVYMGDSFLRNPAVPIYERLQFYSSNPIDLSLGPRRHHEIIEQRRLYAVTDSIKSEPAWLESQETNNNVIGLKVQGARLTVSSSVTSANSTQAVDLTCRKRGNYTSDETSPPEKVQKSNSESGAEEAAAKSVKLFKPYLLGDEENTSGGNKSTGDQKDPIIWSNHPTACIASSGYETQSTHSSNFQSSSDPAYTFPIGSPTSSTGRFQGSPATSVYDRTTPPTISALWCPKGSPVSGYDTASTYSDSSEYLQHPPQYNHQRSLFGHHTYSLDLKMQAIDSYYHDMTCRGDHLAVAGKFNVHRTEVQRWLDQEANIRQGIALYV